MINHDFNDIDHDDFDREVTRIPQNLKAKQQLENNILKQAENYLEDISEDEHSFLIKTLQNLAVDESYFNVIADHLEQPIGTKFANDALNLVHFWKLINDVDDVKTFDLLDIVNGAFFQSEMLKAFDTLEIGEQKEQFKTVLVQSFKLYQSEFYVGCVPVLYALLEGLLTAVLVQHGYLKQQDSKFIDVYKIVPGLKGHEIKSLWHKAKIAHELNPYFSELPAYKMDSSSTVSATRHNILHGSELNCFTQGRCFVLFIWLFGTVSFMGNVRS